MTRVNKDGFLERRTTKMVSPGRARTPKGKARRAVLEERCWRDWYLVRAASDGYRGGSVYLGEVSLPPEYEGKRVQFKIEVLP